MQSPNEPRRYDLCLTSMLAFYMITIKHSLVIMRRHHECQCKHMFGYVCIAVSRCSRSAGHPKSHQAVASLFQDASMIWYETSGMRKPFRYTYLPVAFEDIDQALVNNLGLCGVPIRLSVPKIR